jgi:H+/gluconate symporter-like permease
MSGTVTGGTGRGRMFGRRRRVAGDGEGPGVAAGAAMTAASLLATLISLVAALVAIVIAAGIAFVVLDANAGNSIVSTVHDAAKLLVGPFDGMFHPGDHKLTVAVNWGIALVVYLVVARIVVRLLRR